MNKNIEIHHIQICKIDIKPRFGIHKSNQIDSERRNKNKKLVKQVKFAHVSTW